MAQNYPSQCGKKQRFGEVLSNKYLPNAMQRTLFSQIIGKARNNFSVPFPLKPGIGGRVYSHLILLGVNMSGNGNADTNE